MFFVNLDVNRGTAAMEKENGTNRVHRRMLYRLLLHVTSVVSLRRLVSVSEHGLSVIHYDSPASHSSTLEGLETHDLAVDRKLGALLADAIVHLMHRVVRVILLEADRGVLLLGEHLHLADLSVLLPIIASARSPR